MAYEPSSYTPPWAPHVTSRFPEKKVDEETGQLEPMHVEMHCSLCDTSYKHLCERGAPQQWVQKFALVHVHRDPFPTPPKKESSTP